LLNFSCFTVTSLILTICGSSASPASRSFNKCNAIAAFDVTSSCITVSYVTISCQQHVAVLEQ
jgi:hypothetical protein